METAKLTGAALDWAVAKCLHGNLFMEPYSTNWAHGGPIIERECISLFNCYGDAEWSASTEGYEYHATTPLIAAMRCYVASKLGKEIDIPADLDF